MENTLLKKLKVKPEHSFLVLNASDNYFSDLRIHHSGIVSNDYSLAFADVIQVFITHENELEITLKRLEKLLKSNPIFWICHPKKISGITTDLESLQQWEPLKKFKLRPVASISVDENWTALQIKLESLVKKSSASQSEISKSEFSDYINIEKREVVMPKELVHVLKNEQEATKFFDSLSFSNKKEYIVWILSAKQEQTKIVRLEKTVEKLRLKKKNPNEK